MGERSSGEAVAPLEVRSVFEPAPREQMERMFDEAEQSLHAVEFFKYGTGEHVMRSIRSVLNRARLDSREIKIWFGIFKEIRAHADRVRSRS